MLNELMLMLNELAEHPPKDGCRVSVLTSSGSVLLAGPSVLTRVVVAGSRPSAALKHPEHPPARASCPLLSVARPDGLPAELQALQAAGEAPRATGGVGCKEQSTLGTHHPARLRQAGGGRAVLVQGQRHGGGRHLQQHAVPLTVGKRIGSDLQPARRRFPTSVGEVQPSAAELRAETEGQSAGR